MDAWRRWRAGVGALLTAGWLVGCQHGIEPVELGSVVELSDGNTSLRVLSDQAVVTFEGLSVALGVGATATARRIDEAIEIERGDLRERLALHDGQLHQTFHFDGRIFAPRVLRSTVRGMRFDREDAAGLHFVAENAAGVSVPIRYSHGRLIDAEGRSRPVLARWVDGAIELSIPASPELVAPIVLDPVLGPELPTDAPVATVSRAIDRVALTPSGAGYSLLYSAEGIRSLALGTDLSSSAPHGVPLTTAIEPGWRPAVVRAGSVMLAAWMNGDAELFVRRYGPDGAPLDAAPLLIESGAGVGEPIPSLASDGTDFLVVYSLDLALYAVRISGAGVRLDPTPLLVDDHDCFEAAAAFHAGRYIVAGVCDPDFDGDAEIVAAPLTSAGVVGAPIVVGDAALRETAPVFATSGTSLLMGWMERRNVPFTEQGGRIFARRLDADGALALGPVIEVAASPSGTRPTDLAVSDDGATALFAWSERAAPSAQTTVMWARLGALDVLLDATPQLLGQGFAPALAPGAGVHVIAYASSSPLGSPLGRRIRDDGSYVEAAPVPLAQTANLQNAPVIAGGGGIFLATFRDERPPSGMYAVRVDPVAGVLDTPAMRLGPGLPGFTASFVGDGFQVFYGIEAGDGMGTDLWAVHVALDGSVDPPLRWHSAPGEQYGPRASYVDGHVLLSWLDATSGQDQVWARSYLPDGTPSGSAVEVFGDRAATQVWTAAGHGVHALAWRHRGSTGSIEVFSAVRFSAAGTRLDPVPLVLPGRRSTQMVLFTTSVGFLVLASNDDDAYSAILDPTSGVVSTPHRLTPLTGASSWQGAFEADGLTWGVRYRGLTGLEILPLGIDGMVPSGMTAMPLPLGETTFEIGVASGAPGWALTYSRSAPEAPFATERVYVRVGEGSLLGLGTPCTSDASCSTGFCTDGVCCEARCAGGTSDCQACSVAAGSSSDGVCAPLALDTLCRNGAGVCDPSERCDGVARSCPPDTSLPDGAACGDALVCNGVEVCAAGACSLSPPLDCDDLDPCTIDTCAEPSGCTHDADPMCLDAGLDGGTDSGIDGGTDAGLDAGLDAGPDERTDAGSDAGMDDSGSDAGPPEPEPGCGCRAATGSSRLGWTALFAIALLCRRRVTTTQANSTDSSGRFAAPARALNLDRGQAPAGKALGRDSEELESQKEDGDGEQGRVTTAGVDREVGLQTEREGAP